MLSRLRKRCSFVATLLALFVATVGAPHSSDPKHDSDRAILVVVAVPHSETDHQLQAAVADPAGHESHCVICHFARSFRPRGDARPVSAPPSDTAAHLPFEVFSAAPTALVAQPPLRSPPASLRNT
jgi:hypothetical protein